MVMNMIRGGLTLRIAIGITIFIMILLLGSASAAVLTVDDGGMISTGAFNQWNTVFTGEKSPGDDYIIAGIQRSYGGDQFFPQKKNSDILRYTGKNEKRVNSNYFLNNHNVVSDNTDKNGKDRVIIQFYEEPVLNYAAKLKTELLYKQDADKSEANKKIKAYKESIFNKHSKAKKEIEQNNIKIKYTKEYYGIFNGVAAEVSEQDILKLRKISDIKAMYPDQKVYASLTDSVTLINATSVWAMLDANSSNITGKNVKVAIVDTGIDYTHPDLGGGFGPGYKVIGGWDVYNNDSDPMDDYGHGTHVAGIVAANGSLKGVAPDAQLIAYKVLGPDGSGSFSNVIAGIEKAVDPDGDPLTDDGADIISMSLGGWGDPDDPASQAVDNAVDNGVVVVVAAGNSGPWNMTIGSPGTARKAITVGATDKQDIIADFSSRGPVVWNGGTIVKPDIVAPGVSINSTVPGGPCNLCSTGRYIILSGTSMATPMIAGTVALLLQKNHNWSPAEVKMALRGTAKDLSYDANTQGYGRVDALKAAILDSAPPIAALKTSGIVNGTINITGTALGSGFANYTVEYGDGSGTWLHIGNSSEQVNGGILIQGFDTTATDDGGYFLRLVARSSSGTAGEDRSMMYINNIELNQPLNNDIFRLGDTIEINGTVRGDIENYTFEYGKGYEPVNWSDQGVSISYPGSHNSTINGILAAWDTSSIAEAGFYTLRITVYRNTSISIEYVRNIYFDPALKIGWPVRIPWESSTCPWSGNEVCYYGGGFLEPTVRDIDNDGLSETIVYSGGVPPKVYVFNPNGSLRAGWPANIGSEGVGGGNLHVPLVADIDNDGLSEILALNYNSVYPSSSELYVFRPDGSIMNGWPVLVPRDYFPTILVADLDNDRKKEIVLKGNNAADIYLTILNSSGTVASQWQLNYVSWGGSIVSSPAIGNFDDDGDLEIVVAMPSSSAGYHPDTGTMNNTGVIYVFNPDGSNVSGWPIYTDGIPFSSPSIGDLDNDGYPEIVIGLLYSSNTFPDYSYGGLYAFHKNGTVMPGWPFMKGYNFWSSPSLADFNGDGTLEIAASRLGFETYVLYPNATLLPGWPRQTVWNDYYSTIAGDINGDGAPEVITTSGNGIPPYGGGVYAWDINGTLLDGFPKVTEMDAQGPAALGDIDNDGRADLLASSNFDYDLEMNTGKHRGTIYAWDAPGIYNPRKNPWPAFHHDASRTGLYNYTERNVESNITIKALVINFDPIIESEGSLRLHEVLGWNDPHQLASDYVSDLREASSDRVQYQVVQWIDADAYPGLIDGFQYTDDTYLTAWRNGGPWHEPWQADYYQILADYNITARIAAGEIDEVLMFGGPYFGFYESRMAGPGAYDVNAPSMPDVESGRLFILMGFSYERLVGSMLEDFGHRTESIMTHVYGSWNSSNPEHNWDNFTMFEMVAPGNASCGNVHYAPNALTPGDDYDYGNPNYVWSTCDDWLSNWPNLNGTKKWVNGSEWGGGDARLYFNWWFRHIPNKPGVNPDGKQNSWWKYMADFNSYPESNGEPRTITVDDSGGADYTRIQDAVNAARDRDTILVYSGTYYENVNVNKRLTLRGIDNGAGKPVVDALGTGSSITLSAEGITLVGFTAINAGSYPDAGINVLSSRNTISGNNASSNNHYGIYLIYSSNSSLSNNHASNNDFGIYLYSSSNTMLVNNTVQSNRYDGIRLEFSYNNTLGANGASNNNAGIYLGYSDNNIIDGNTANLNSNYGFYSDTSGSNILINNNASDNSGIGIDLFNSSNNILYQNSLSNNTNYNAYDTESNQWDSGAIGNRYSNFDEPAEGCTDADNNGICDTAYNIPGGLNIDRYPQAAGNIPVPPVPEFPVNSVEKRGYVTSGPFAWDAQNFPAFYYDLKDDARTETLSVSSIINRDIPVDGLAYETDTILRNYQVYINKGIPVNGRENYSIIGWQGEIRVGLNNKANKLSHLILEQKSFEKKTLTAGETWDLGEGWTLTAMSIDAKAVPRQVWLALDKNGVRKSDRVLTQGQVYVYSENLSGESDAPLFVTYIDAIFAGAITDMVQLKYTWLISDNVTVINAGDRFSSLVVINATDSGLVLRNDAVVVLQAGSAINITDVMRFRIADNATLRYYPFVEYTAPGTYEIRGSVATSAKRWDAYNFSAFYYDIKDDAMTETLDVSSLSNRNIPVDGLAYVTHTIPRDYQVYINPGILVNGRGNYSIIGWQGQIHVGLNNKANKLSHLIMEQKSTEKRTFLTGENWDLGEGWTLIVLAIDAKADPRQVWLELDKNGVKKDDRVIARGQAYVYSEDLSGETNAPLFVTYVDSIFAGATSDMVQLKYTWLISDDVAVIPVGGRLGNLIVKTASDLELVLKNDAEMLLSGGSTVNITDRMRFRIADNNTLRYYPYVEKTILSDTKPPASITNLQNISYATNYINWTWIDPQDADFDHVEVYIDGSLRNNVQKGVQFYSAPGFAPDTVHTIGTRTVDASGNINQTWVSHNARTAPLPDTTPEPPVGRVEIRGTVASAPQVWDAYSFSALYYRLDDDARTETLGVSALNNRDIPADSLSYETRTVPRNYQVYITKGIPVNGKGNYSIIGWLGQMHVGLNDKANRLSHIILEQGPAEKRTLNVGEAWDLGEGWMLTAVSIDAKSIPRQVWLELRKNGLVKDDRVVAEGEAYVYSENIYGDTNVPLLVTYVDSIFAGATSDMAQLKYTWLVSDNVTIITGGERFGNLTVRSATELGLVLRNDAVVTLLKGGTVNITDATGFRIADNDTLRYYPFVELEKPGVYEIRGKVADGTMLWDAYNMSAFYYDLDDDARTEMLSVSSLDLRSILADGLTYETHTASRDYQVYINRGIPVNGNGKYSIIGWQGKKYIALKDKANKLARQVLEQAPTDNKTLGINETWDMGDGYNLTLISIDWHALPGQAWVVLEKNGTRLDDKVLIEGEAYVYTRTLAGELDAPLFVTYAENISNSHIVLKYSWLVSDDVTVITAGERFGSLAVRYTTDLDLVLMNDAELLLSKGSIVNIMNGLNLRIADNDTLRYYPFMEKTITNTTPPAGVSNLQNTSYEQNYIIWMWYDPANADLDHVEIYIDGNYTGDVLKGVEFYNASGFAPSTEHTISTRTVDTSGNINRAWVNHTARTAPIPDAIPPASITNLQNVSYATTYINWTWNDPADADFSMVIIYLDGVFRANVTGGVHFYNATGLIADSLYEISTRTIDSAGNVNQTWVNHTARTGQEGMKIITVDDSGGADYTRIQDAINNARTEDTILVYSGLYHENVNINKQLVLSGIDDGGGKPVVDGNMISSVVTLSAGNSTLSGFTVINSGTGEYDAGILVNSNNNTIRNYTASNNSNGVYLYYSSNNKLSGNASSNNNRGIFLLSSSDNVLEGNTASYIRGSGIVLGSYSNNNRVSGNIAANNNNGIFLANSQGNNIIGNTAFGNEYGIYISSSSNNLVSNNIVSESKYNGIYIWSSSGNSIYNNVFNNTNNLGTGSSVNTWNVTKTPAVNIIGGPYIGGNVWIKPDGRGFSQTCADGDRDGICDSPYVLESSNIDHLPLQNNIMPPSSVANLRNITFENSYINWTWTDPADPDLFIVLIYLDGVIQANVSKGAQFYNATGLAAETQYVIGTHTVDIMGNVNQTWVNHTAKTAPMPDTTPPASVMNLQNTSYAQTYINWTWTDPADNDLDRVAVYLDGTFKTNVTKGIQYYNATGLSAATVHTISTRTVDTAGNVNMTPVEHTAMTALPPDTPPGSVTNLTNVSYAKKYINWTWTDPSDSDFNRVMVYIDGKFKTNITKGVGYYRATGLIPNNLYTISTHTVDISGNINLTWVNHTARTA